MNGKKFGRLTVLRKDLGCCKYPRWFCRCDCGKEIVVRGYSLSSGNTKSCGCYQKEQTSKATSKKPYWWVYTLVKSKSKNRSIKNLLTYLDILEFVKIDKCHYCQDKIVWPTRGSSKTKGHHLDRMDNLKGYSKENCVVCCTICNKIKNNYFTHDEMLELGVVVKKIREKNIMGLSV